METTEIGNGLKVILRDLHETNKVLTNQSQMLEKIAKRTEILDEMNLEMEAQLALHEAFLDENGLVNEFGKYCDAMIDEFNNSQASGPKMVRVK